MFMTRGLKREEDDKKLQQFISEPMKIMASQIWIWNITDFKRRKIMLDHITIVEQMPL